MNRMILYRAKSETSAQNLTEFLNNKGDSLGLEEVTFTTEGRDIFSDVELDQFDQGFVAGLCRGFEA